MRIYSNPRELMSEAFRDVFEMGVIVRPQSMQNKDISGNDDFVTKEITNYSYCLLQVPEKLEHFLFVTDPRSKAWAEAEILERVSDAQTINPGEAYKIREDLWSQFLNEKGEFDYTYHDRLNCFEGIEKIITRIVEDPGSRQLILAMWEPSDIMFIGGQRRVPCTLNYQFLVREGKIHIIYNQRSADVVAHFGNDIYLAYRLMKYITDEVNKMVEKPYKYGNLFHNIGSLHAYKKDWDILKTSIDVLKK